MKKGLSFLFYFLILSIPKIYAQDFCAQKLNEAEDKFEQGKFYEIPDMLSLCLNNGFTKEEKVRAYRLLTITYLYLDYSEKADESYLSLLRLSPEYEVSEDLDPKELINHHKKFTTRPYVYFSIKAGVNISDYYKLQDVSLTIAANKFEQVKRALGYNFNLGGEIALFKNVNLGVEGNLTRTTFDYRNYQFFTVDQAKGLETNLRQVYTSLSVPLYLKFSFYKPKISPFLLAGVAPSYLLMANSINQTADFKSEQISREEPNFEITDSRRRINYALLGGVGLKYKLGINYLTCEVRYHMSMLNYVNRDKRYDTSLGSGETYRFGLVYVDDDFKLNNLSIMLGFTYPIYKPRKISD